MLADRVLVTLVVLRLQLPHQATAVPYGVDRATITRAVGEVRPLLAARGFAVPDPPRVRLRTLAEVIAYAAVHGVELRIDGTETQVRRLDPECARAVIEAAGQQPARARSAWPEGLSEREVDVLRLVARGLSNRQIAAALVISPRTAEHHVQHIYAKIGASTRAAAAMFATEHGLLR